MKTFFSLLFVASTLTAMACSSSEGDKDPRDVSPDASADASPAPDGALPTCAAKGGACTAVVPGSCTNGTVDTAVSDCGSGQVGAACCIPKPSPKPSCASRGGTCVPVTPNACAGGTIDPDAECSGGVGAACCLTGDAG